MTIKRISQLTEKELKESNCQSMTLQHYSTNADKDIVTNYTLEIISSIKAMNTGLKKVYSTIVIYTADGIMIHHEVYIDTLTPEQIREAQMFISNNLEIYLKKKNTSKVN